jgi:DNA-binding SARP family transcriptional activator
LPAQRELAAVRPLLRVYAFGQSRVLRGDQLVTSAEWGMAKSKELLIYLLCFKQRRKDQIGSDLWQDLSPAKLRSAFHVALYRLRRALDQQDCIMYESDQYYFNRRINYWFDVEEFEQAIHRGASAWNTDRARAAQHYGDAVVLYTGDFADDFSSSRDWCLLKREELLQKHLIALLRLGEYDASEGRYGRAIQFYEKALAKDSFQESAHRAIMRCQALLGERSAALKTYHRLAELLETELGADPASESTALYEQILRGEVLGPTP